MKTLNEDYPLYPVQHIASLQDLVLVGATKHPDRLALQDLNDTPINRLTYAGLREAVLRFARALRRVGLNERDHIAVIGDNRVQWVVAYLAAHAGNFVVVPIDKSLSENEIVTVLHASDARAVVFSEHFRSTIVSSAYTAKNLDVLVDMDAPAAQGKVHSMAELVAKETDPVTNDDLPAVDPDAPAVISFTSGSMGRAKGVVLSQRNVASNLMDMLAMIELTPEDRFLSVLPIHHLYECTCGVLCPLLAGASVSFARNLKTVVEDLQTVHATVLLGVPLLYEKMYRRIAAAINESKVASRLIPPMRALAAAGETVGLAGLRKTLFRSIHERLGGAIRILVVGGAAPDPEVARGMRSFGFQFVQGYGLTETSPIVALNRLRKLRDDAAGIPLPSVKVRIVDPDAEGIGEIAVQGPSVMLGYYKMEEATNKVLRDGWFFTGDLGRFDADGFLHVSGRKKNVIVASNGKNVFPEELEDRVNAIPVVLESVVHGVKTASGSEEIRVMVVPDAEEFLRLANGDDREMTRDWIEQVIDQEIRALNRKLPLYKQIRRVEVKEHEFEKTTTHKIKRYLVHQEESTH